MTHDDFAGVVTLMEEVGRQIASWRYDKKARHLHSETDFKTDADWRAHQLIADGLTQLFPSVEIISEESPVHTNTRPSAYWLIDPIDGTASWYHGFDGFVTQAAFITNGQPLYGIIHAPIAEKTWSAVRGDGAYLNGSRMPLLKPNQRLIMTDNTPIPHGVTKDIAALLSVTDYLESGSLGLKSVLIADGTADLFVKDVCVRDWDLAPSAVILHEVGGRLSLTNGDPYVFDGSYEKTGGFIVARDIELLGKAITAFTQCKIDRCRS
jgi:3'(2'), 5'-bisphosphate nucleotidase